MKYLVKQVCDASGLVLIMTRHGRSPKNLKNRRKTGLKPVVGLRAAF